MQIWKVGDGLVTVYSEKLYLFERMHILHTLHDVHACASTCTTQIRIEPLVVTLTIFSKPRLKENIKNYLKKENLSSLSLIVQ